MWSRWSSILQAEDTDALRAVLASHPHNRIGTIEVLQMLDMPGATP